MSDLNDTPSLFVLIKRLWTHLPLSRRRQVVTLSFFIVLSAVTEVISIGAVIPFLGVLMQPELIFNHEFLRPMINLMGIKNSSELSYLITITFISAAVLAALMRILLLWVSTRLSFKIGRDIGFSIYRKTLYQPYKVHLETNSSELMSGVTTKANSIIFDLTVPVLALLSSGAMGLAIISFLVMLNPTLALVSMFGFGLAYITIRVLTKRKIAQNSQTIALESTNVIKALQEGLGGIRDVLINGSQEIYCGIYGQSDKALRESQGSSLFITLAPRYGIEGLGMIVIASVAYFFTRDAEEIGLIVPALGALALGAQRLLPIMQQGYAGVTQISNGKASLIDVLAFLDAPLPKHLEQRFFEPIEFNKGIELKDISYRYDKTQPYLFKGLNLFVEAGSRVGIVGPTGVGKSTLIDMVMGLLVPESGSILVDDVTLDEKNTKSWQNKIAHVPQDIFLSDASVEENIAFGVPKELIDSDWVRQCASRAKIAEVIEGLPAGYGTFVGERGVRLSGGQKQRLGVARALYRRASLIVFDEATSALDNETEISLMKEIESLDKNMTLLMIAHRRSTLSGCTKIVELCDGGISKIGGYLDFAD